TIAPLQALSTSAVTFALSVSGLIAHIEGNLITIPAGRFEIAEGCSGMRYVMVSLALASFYGLFWYRTWVARIGLLVLAGVVSMVANWIRIYTLILIGHLTEMQHYVVAESHD